MKPTNDIWPPPPTWPQPEADADANDWLSANDFIPEVTWRDYAVILFAVFWLVLTCLALAFHHHLLTGIVEHAHHAVHTDSP